MNYSKLRKIQSDTLDSVIKAIEDGKTDIFIQAPTGTGKGLLSLELTKHFYDSIGDTSYLLTSEKSLQKQYETDCNEKFDGRHENVTSLCGVDTYKCNVNNEKFSLGVCRSMGLSNARALQLQCGGG